MLKTLVTLLTALFISGSVAHAQVATSTVATSTPTRDEIIVQIMPVLSMLAQTLETLNAEYIRDQLLLEQYGNRLSTLVQSVGYLTGVPFGEGTPPETNAEHDIVNVTAASVENTASTIRSDLQAIDSRRVEETKTLANISQNIKDLATIIENLK